MFKLHLYIFATAFLIAIGNCRKITLNTISWKYDTCFSKKFLTLYVEIPLEDKDTEKDPKVTFMSVQNPVDTVQHKYVFFAGVDGTKISTKLKLNGTQKLLAATLICDFEKVYDRNEKFTYFDIKISHSRVWLTYQFRIKIDNNFKAGSTNYDSDISLYQSIRKYVAYKLYTINYFLVTKSDVDFETSIDYVRTISEADYDMKYRLKFHKLSSSGLHENINYNYSYKTYANGSSTIDLHTKLQSMKTYDIVGQYVFTLKKLSPMFKNQRVTFLYLIRKNDLAVRKKSPFTNILPVIKSCGQAENHSLTDKPSENYRDLIKNKPGCVYCIAEHGGKDNITMSLYKDGMILKNIQRISEPTLSSLFLPISSASEENEGSYKCLVISKLLQKAVSVKEDFKLIDPLKINMWKLIETSEKILFICEVRGKANPIARIHWPKFFMNGLKHKDVKWELLNKSGSAKKILVTVDHRIYNFSKFSLSCLGIEDEKLYIKTFHKSQLNYKSSNTTKFTN